MRTPETPGLTIDVLGTVEVRHTGGTIAVRSPQERALLAHLVIRLHRTVPAEELVETLWRATPPRTAHKSLQNHVVRLRRILEPGAHGRSAHLITDSGGYRLELADHAIDSRRFEALADLGRAAYRDGRVQGASDALRRALTLWRDRAFLGLDSTPIIGREARRLDDLRLLALEDRFAADLDLGLAREVVGEIQALVDAHPLRERLWCLLALGLYRADRQSDSLDSCRRARALLAEELGAEPGPALRQLEVQLLRHDPALDVPTRAITLPGALVPQPGAFVGRDSELELLRTQWQRVRSTEVPAAALVTGPEGAGVHRLGAELAAELADHGTPVEHWQDVPGNLPPADSPTLTVLDLRGWSGNGTVLPAEWASRGPRLVLVLAREVSADPVDLHVRLGPVSLHDAQAILAAYDAGAPAAGDVAEALRQSGGLPGRLHEIGLSRAIGSATARVTDATVQAQEVGQRLSSLRRQLRDGLSDFREAVERGEPVLDDACPWRGLSTYEVADAPWYAGRERFVAELLALVASGRFVTVVGSSGSGKSSLLRAGLLASIHQGALPGSQDWQTWLMRPGRHPMRALRAVAAAFDPPRAAEQGDHAGSTVQPPTRRVLVVDQVEEVWTVCDDPAERVGFLDSLARMLSPSSPCTLVIAVRGDHVGHLADHPELARELLEGGTMLVGAPTEHEFRRMVQHPAQRAGLVLEAGLVDALVDDAAHEPGALPLLSTALQELWIRRRGRSLTLASHVAGGGLRGAVARLAEGAYSALDDEDRAATRVLLLRLAGVGSGGSVSRRRVPLAELEALPNPHVRAVVEPLSDARLLTVDAEHVEVAHEALFREWPRLRGWLDEQSADRTLRRRLVAAAQDWVDAGRDPAEVWQGSSLAAGLDLLASASDELTADEVAFLRTGRDRMEAERRAADARARQSARQNLRLKGLLGASAAFLAVASIAGIMAARSQQTAEEEARIAQARELAAAANSVLPTDPELSVLLASRAAETTRGPDGHVLPEAEEALHRAVVGSRVVEVIPGVGGGVALSPDGSEFVPEGPEGSGVVQVHDVRTGELLRSWQAHAVDLNDVVIGPDGTLVTSGDDGTVIAWDLATGRERGRVSGPEPREDVYNPEVSADGSIIAGGWSTSGTVRVHDVRSGRTIRTFDVDRGWVLALSPDGRQIALSVDEGGLAVFDVMTGRKVFDLAGEGLWTVADLAWSPDGRWVAGSLDGSGRVWDSSTGELVAMLVPGHTGYAPVIKWSPDSTTLATAGHDGTARVWRRSGEDFVHVATLSALSTRDGVLGAAFTPDSRLLYAGGFDVLSAITVFDVSAAGSAEWATIATPFEWSGLGFAPDGTRLYLGSETTDARVVDPTSGRSLGTIGRRLDATRVGEQLAREVEVSPDGLLATASEDGVRVVDPSTGELVLEYAPEKWWPAALAWSPDGLLLAVAGHEDGSTVVLDLSGNEVGRVQEEEPYTSISVAFSPDGTSLAVGRLPIGVQLGLWGITLWDWRNRESLRTIDAEAQRVVFTRDGLLVNADRRGPVLVSDPVTGEEAARLIGHTGGTWDLDMSTDGTRMATVGRDGTVRIWDTRTWTQLLALPAHEGSAIAVRFSPDGRQLATLGEDGLARLWAMEFDDLLRISQEKATRGLTEQECRQYLHSNTCA
jgi:WD40 repeat protein/DNA-binding SARP family transcriptional activator/energy-coupling factor transporter ATP-binding protein EcfA2